MVLRLRMDEGTGATASDSSGNSNNGTLSSATWGAGKYSNAVSFNGSNSLVTVADSAGLRLNQMTVEAWVYIPSSVTTRRIILGKGGWKNQNYGLWVETDDMGAGPVGHLMFHFDYDDLNVGAGVHTPLAYNDNTWHHVAGTYDGTDLKIYIDGALVATKNYPGLTPDTTADALYIGGYMPGTTGPAYTYFNDSVDEMRIYNRALSAAEVMANYTGLPEVCDDGGISDGDGCAGTCSVENTWFCSGFPSSCYKYCIHSIYLSDSGGDGWDGALINVVTNGINQYAGLTLAGGGGGGWYNYTVYHGANESVVYTAAGNFPYECSFEIRDAADGAGSSVVNATYPTAYSAIAICP
jgi:cysteine-rich repeat protein